MIGLVLGVLALFAFSKGKTAEKTDKGNPSLTPKPGADDPAIRAFVCELVQQGHTTATLLPLLLRELYPAVSWPAADEWTDEEVRALPVEDLSSYAKGKRLFETMTKDDAWLSQCARAESPYATGRVRRKAGRFQASWSYDIQVHGDRGGVLTTADFDTARTMLLNGVWWFGASPSELDTFVEAQVKPGTENRLSIWEMPGGGLRVVVMRSDREPESFQVGTLADARAVVWTL